jgi:hypothetical protein
MKEFPCPWQVLMGDRRYPFKNECEEGLFVLSGGVSYG